MNLKQKFFLILALATTVFIFRNSSLNAVISSSDSGFFVNILSSILETININADTGALTVFIRKAAHFTEFALQALFIGGFFISSGKNIKSCFGKILASGFITACTDEIIQLTSAGRSCQVSDIFLDYSGTFIGVLIILLIEYIYSKITRM